jgi:HK97 family phage prohead protease
MKNKPSQPKKVSTPTQERRFLANGELRIKAGAAGKKIFGYAAKFGVLSEDLGGWREKIDPRAFDASISGGDEIVALFNHDVNLVLGRRSAKTLRVSTDKVGLLYEIDPPATQVAKDLLISMERGDVHQSSFAFQCSDDSWDLVGNEVIRTVLKATVRDVSPVTSPAYLDATSGVRVSLRNCPWSLRGKIKADKVQRDEDNPEQDADVTECDCTCPECSENDDCEQCSNSNCESDLCVGCSTQILEAHRSLLMRRLRS